MDAYTTVALASGAALYVALLLWVAWLHRHTVRWAQVERVKVTLAEQEEALSSLFDKLNTVLARWRKREQRAEARAQENDQGDGPSARKLELYRRLAERRSNGSTTNRLPLFAQEPQEQEAEE